MSKVTLPNYRWIKFDMAYLEDFDFMQLSDASAGLYLKLYLLAGKADAGGILCDTRKIFTLKDIAWLLRGQRDLVNTGIEELISAGLIERQDGGFVLTRFMEEQGPADDDSRLKYRDRQRKHRDQVKTDPAAFDEDLEADTALAVDFREDIEIEAELEGEGEEEEIRESRDIDSLSRDINLLSRDVPAMSRDVLTMSRDNVSLARSGENDSVDNAPVDNVPLDNVPPPPPASAEKSLSASPNHPAILAWKAIVNPGVSPTDYAEIITGLSDPPDRDRSHDRARSPDRARSIDRDRLQAAFAEWSKQCDQAAKNGKTWSKTRPAPIIERYQTLAARPKPLTYTLDYDHCTLIWSDGQVAPIDPDGCVFDRVKARPMSVLPKIGRGEARYLPDGTPQFLLRTLENRAIQKTPQEGDRFIDRLGKPILYHLGAFIDAPNEGETRYQGNIRSSHLKEARLAAFTTYHDGLWQPSTPAEAKTYLEKVNRTRSVAVLLVEAQEEAASKK